MISEIKVKPKIPGWYIKRFLAIHHYTSLFLRCFHYFTRFNPFDVRLYNVSTFSDNPPNSYMTYHSCSVISAPTSSKHISNQCTMILLMNLEPAMDLSYKGKWKWASSIKITPIFHFNQTSMIGLIYRCFYHYLLLQYKNQSQLMPFSSVD